MGYRALKELDWPLIIVTLILSGLGILQVYSATNGTKWDSAWEKQIIWVLTGLVMMWATAVIGYQTLMAQVLYLYTAVIGLLFATTFIGSRPSF
jgi:rod shape determining protein RodA